jgi:hypothetical protein
VRKVSYLTEAQCVLAENRHPLAWPDNILTDTEISATPLFIQIKMCILKAHCSDSVKKSSVQEKEEDYNLPPHSFVKYRRFVDAYNLYIVLKNSISWDITSCSPLKVKRHFGITCHVLLRSRRIIQRRNRHEADSKQSSCLMLVSSLAYIATRSSETSVEFQQATRRHIPEVEGFITTTKILKPYR